MNIRTKIALTHGVILAAVVGFCLALLTILGTAEQRRVEQIASYEQLRAIDLVQARANRFSEQIAELFILGAPGLADMREARASLAEAIEALATLWRLEAVTQGRAPPASTQEMTTVMQALEAASAEIRRRLAAGRTDEAAAYFATEVELGLDRRMKGVIADAAAAEQKQAVRAAASGDVLRRRAAQLSIGLAAATVALTAAAALFLNRNISHRIMALSEAADALARGEAPTAAPEGPDELGRLAKRFNVMAAEIARSRDRLQEAVAQRTRDLSNRTAELETANKRLRALETARAQFLAEVSHELRTPLTVIRTEAEIALRAGRGDPEVLIEAAAIAARKARQMGELVDNLMFLARSDSPEWTVDAEPIVLQELVDEALEDGAVIARPSGVRLRPTRPDAPIVVQGDGARLRQVLLIVIDNAVRFSPQDGAIDIELARDGGEAVLAVADCGPGFAPEYIRRAFQRFHRGASPANAARAGSGLGLAIARWIIEKHGGRIDIRTAAGGGARVELRLPLLETAA